MVLPQVAQHAAEAAQASEPVQDQPHDLWTCSSGSNCEFAVRADHVAGRRLAEPFAAAGPVEAAGLHALLELMQLEASHEPLDGQDQAIVEVDGMIQAILIGEQGVEGVVQTLIRRQQASSSRARRLIWKPEHQADVAEGDFGEQPGEIVAADGGGAGAALIAVEDADAVGGPAPGEGALPEVGLDLGGFAVALDLLGMGLADIDDGPTIQMVAEDLGGSDAGERFRGVIGHLPRGAADLGRGGAGAGGSGGSAGWRSWGVNSCQRGVVRRSGVGGRGGGLAGVGAWHGGPP